MAEYKTSAQLVVESGLSRERVNQLARAIKVQKIGAYYLWSKADEAILYERIGMRGRKIENPCQL